MFRSERLLLHKYSDSLENQNGYSFLSNFWAILQPAFLGRNVQKKFENGISVFVWFALVTARGHGFKT